MKEALIITSLTVLMAGVLHAQASAEIYVSTGEHGEISFSDVAVPGAERVQVETSQPTEDSLAELERRIEQTLTVADALERSRRAREASRAEARSRAATTPAPQPQVVYQDRYVDYPYSLRSPYDHRFGQRFDHHGRFRHRDRFDKFPHGDRDVQDRPSRERTRSRTLVYDPD